MTERKLTDAEALELWRRAEHRLRLVDREPPVALATVDALLQVVGRRRQGEPLSGWLERGRVPAAERPSAEIIRFSPKFNPQRQRFTAVAEIVRLAADSAGSGIALPGRELETADGRFRLKVTRAGDQLLIALQALGHAADQFAGAILGLAPAIGAAEPLVLIELDEDGDGEVRVPDGEELRAALLKPVIGVLEDL